MTRTLRVQLATIAVVSAIMLSCAASPPRTSVITVNRDIVHQTMTGWELPVLSTVVDYLDIEDRLDALMDRAANDLGINKIVVEVSSGAENPSDGCQRAFLDRTLSEREFTNTCAYNSMNDNDDPSVVNPDGFHFVLLDWQIEHLLLPLKRHVEARGEKLYVLLRYTDYGAARFEHYRDPDEYAEFMQVTFDHIRSQYGFTPDGIDVVNEPDLEAEWNAAAIGAAAARTGSRLAARGWHPDFVAASTVDKGHAAPYFDVIMAVPGAREYVTDLSWHCYRDSRWNSSDAIAAAARRFGVRTSMTECWTRANHYRALHQELKRSRNSSWQLAPITAGEGYYDVSGGQIALRPKAKYIRQYFKYVRAGATRVEATSSNSRFDPVAFLNQDGNVVVIVMAKASGTFSIAGLPAGTYSAFQTTGPDPLTVRQYDVVSPEQTIGPGESVTASIADTGVITIYGKGVGKPTATLQ